MGRKKKDKQEKLYIREKEENLDRRGKWVIFWEEV
jgi:hypothetical protein